MVRFFNIWPLATMKVSPIMDHICRSRFNILPNGKWTLEKLPKILPNCQNFDKSGHTILKSELASRWSRKNFQTGIVVWISHFIIVLAFYLLFLVQFSLSLSLSLSLSVCIPDYSTSARGLTDFYSLYLFVWYERCQTTFTQQGNLVELMP